ncbi:hypothetical protein Y1Q_0011782 [Alligator mississippiensis]|uniref:Uncharacterized protein n=1 Tax=Alligator mississippiensis TaxID=8496 RepID=A0A151M133_ALLMI|nr:hypothetical protein Y1Q_0011782 [Alligator mississippiensis]
MAHSCSKAKKGMCLTFQVHQRKDLAHENSISPWGVCSCKPHFVHQRVRCTVTRAATFSQVCVTSSEKGLPLTIHCTGSDTARSLLIQADKPICPALGHCIMIEKYCDTDTPFPCPLHPPVTELRATK